MSTLALSYAADSGAVSQHTNQPFTSFVVIGGRRYGTARDGLYLINEGDDDAGGAIPAVLEGPRTDGGDDAYKRLRSASITGQNIDGLTLSTRTGGGDWRAAMALGGGRFSIGRDNAGREVQWRLEGDGSDFEVSSVVLDIETLGRRARG